MIELPIRPPPARHDRARAALLPLLRAWHEADIHALLFKGFALAEFEYDDPDQRPYMDVDLLIPQEQAARAVQIALTLGLRSDGLIDAPSFWCHEIAHLYTPDGHLRIDLHRWLVHARPVSSARAQLLTRQLLAQARPATLDDVPVSILAPVDQTLLMMFARLWSLDAGHLKPADAHDEQLLRTRHALTDTQIETRARELRCLHSWRALQDTLRRGDSRVPIRALRHALLREYPETYPRWLRHPRTIRDGLVDIARALPHVRRVQAALAGGTDPWQVAQQAQRHTGRRPAHELNLRASRGVRWASKLLRVSPTAWGDALTRHAVMTSQGFRPDLVLAVSAQGEPRAHVWLEYPGADYRAVRLGDWRASYQVIRELKGDA